MKLLTQRTGALLPALIAIIVILVIAGVAGFYFVGKGMQTSQTEILASGYENFSQNNAEKAYRYFLDARKTFGTTLGLYRTISGSDTDVTIDELNELIVSVCMAAAYDDFFVLKASDEWIERGKAELEFVNDKQAKEVFAEHIKNAEFVSNLCRQFAEDKVEESLRELFAVDQQVSVRDHDFFVFQIRFLIACGHALNEPALITQARELLFFATGDAGINNEKTRQLWGILTRN